MNKQQKEAHELAKQERRSERIVFRKILGDIARDPEASGMDKIEAIRAALWYDDRFDYAGREYGKDIFID